LPVPARGCGTGRGAGAAPLLESPRFGRDEGVDATPGSRAVIMPRAGTRPLSTGRPFWRPRGLLCFPRSVDPCRTSGESREGQQLQAPTAPRPDDPMGRLCLSQAVGSFDRRSEAQCRWNPAGLDPFAALVAMFEPQTTLEAGLPLGEASSAVSARRGHRSGWTRPLISRRCGRFGKSRPDFSTPSRHPRPGLSHRRRRPCHPHWCGGLLVTLRWQGPLLEEGKHVDLSAGPAVDVGSVP